MLIAFFPINLEVVMLMPTSVGAVTRRFQNALIWLRLKLGKFTERASLSRQTKNQLEPSPSALTRWRMSAPIPAGRARDHFTRTNMFLNYSAIGLLDRSWRIRRNCKQALLRRLTKMKRKSLQGSLCSVARALDVIGDWWSLLIIHEVIAGPKRFGELQRNLGIAKNILATRLKALSAEGIIEAVPASDGSVYQEYVITIKGRALLPTLVALAQWSSEYLFERREVRSVPLDAKRRRPLKKLVLQSDDGQLLDAGEILIRASCISV